jgi:hypothetical protein
LVVVVLLVLAAGVALVPPTACATPLSRLEAVEPTVVTAPDAVEPAGAGSLLATVEAAPATVETPLATFWAVVDTAPAAVVATAPAVVDAAPATVDAAPATVDAAPATVDAAPATVLVAALAALVAEDVGDVGDAPGPPVVVAALALPEAPLPEAPTD